MATVTFLLAALIGLRVHGLDGMCISGGLAWFILIGISASRECSTLERSERDRDIVSDAIRDLETSMQRSLKSMESKLPPSVGYYSAVLDALSTENYRLLEMPGLKTEEEWERVFEERWVILRRRLIKLYDMDPVWVDRAKKHILQTTFLHVPRPHSKKDWLDLVKSLRDDENRTLSEAEAQEAVARQAELMGLDSAKYRTSTAPKDKCA